MARGPILPKTPPTLDPRGRCGTYAGSQAHRKRGEEQCDECLVARRDYIRESQRRRRSNPKKRAHDNEVSRPLGRAKYHARVEADPQAERDRWRRSYTSQMSRAGSPRRIRVESRRERGRSCDVAGVPSSATLQDRLDYYGGKCWMCGADTAVTGLHWDHVKPLSRGGADALCNLRPSCPSCNLAKSDTWPYERSV